MLDDETMFPSWEQVRDALNNWAIQAKGSIYGCYTANTL